MRRSQLTNQCTQAVMRVLRALEQSKSTSALVGYVVDRSSGRAMLCAASPSLQRVAEVWRDGRSGT